MDMIKKWLFWRDPVRLKQAKVKTRALLLGASREKRGLLASFLLYFTVINISLVYIAPILSMLSTSLKDFADMMNPAAMWFPRTLNFSNYTAAFETLGIAPKNMFLPGFSFLDNIRRSTLLNTLLVVLPTAGLQVFFCAVAGYAFGRMDFPFKRLLFILLILEFVVPPQAQIIPMIWTYRNLKILNTPLVYYAPSLFGHGVKGSLFVFIYMQFFRKLPKEMEEAAMIDGVGPVRIFLKIMIPMAKPAFMVVFLFSLVYLWNEALLASTLYAQHPTLTVRVMNLMNPDVKLATIAKQTVQMAIGVLTISPLLITYFFTQKTFTESIERTGLVE